MQKATARSAHIGPSNSKAHVPCRPLTPQCIVRQLRRTPSAGVPGVGGAPDRCRCSCALPRRSSADDMRRTGTAPPPALSLSAGCSASAAADGRQSARPASREVGAGSAEGSTECSEASAAANRRAAAVESALSSASGAAASASRGASTGSGGSAGASGSASVISSPSSALSTLTHAAAAAAEAAGCGSARERSRAARAESRPAGGAEWLRRRERGVTYGRRCAVARPAGRRRGVSERRGDPAPASGVLQLRRGAGGGSSSGCPWRPGGRRRERARSALGDGAGGGCPGPRFARIELETSPTAGTFRLRKKDCCCTPRSACAQWLCSYA